MHIMHYSLWIIHANDPFKITDSFSKESLVRLLNRFVQNADLLSTVAYVLLGDASQILAWPEIFSLTKQQ